MLTGLRAEQLSAFAQAAAVAVGVPPGDAALFADTLVDADRRGHASHGIFRLPWYIDRIRAGVMNPVTQLDFASDSGSVVVVDGHDGVGQVVAMRAMELAVARARECGIAAVAVRRSNHFGTAAYYTRYAARRGLVGILMTNASPAMAPWGGKEAAVGNNPWSVAVPAGRHGEVVLDIANTVVARGKIYVAAQEGRSIPEGWAMDRHGRPTTSPAAALAGLILPMGGHKGYAISFMLDVLSGVLTGSGFGTGVAGPYQAERRSGAGHLCIALDIARFQPHDQFAARMEDLIAQVKSVPLAEGFSEICYPGEPEERAGKRHAAQGLALPDKTVADLQQLAAELGLALPWSQEA